MSISDFFFPFFFTVLGFQRNVNKILQYNNFLNKGFFNYCKGTRRAIVFRSIVERGCTIHESGEVECAVIRRVQSSYINSRLRSELGGNNADLFYLFSPSFYQMNVRTDFLRLRSSKRTSTEIRASRATTGGKFNTRVSSTFA